MGNGNQIDRPGDKTFLITVNGRQRQVEREELAFDELVDIAFDDPARGPQIVFTITPGLYSADGGIPS
ncbi:MAG: multiubiquitin domain-containing protein [Caldilineaceae bacterium]|nr:multiubiquitin domain-containing protein [Caldilineaceae bacterium]MDE0534316.1 multiubiquitin domain-containing protein [Albidovulum sp.]